MSVEAFSWALRVPIGGNAKVALLGLANHAHPDGTEAYPSLETIAKYAHCDRSTAKRNVRKLEEAGWIERDGHGPRGEAKYKLAMGAPFPRGVQNAPGADEPGEGGNSAHEGGAPAPPEPSIEPSSNRKEENAGASKPDLAQSLPEDFPPELVEHARHVFRVLRSVAEQHNARVVTPRAVGLTMMGKPGRRFVEEAHAMAAWAQAPPRPVRDVVGTYRTWLGRAQTFSGVEQLDGDGRPATEPAAPAANVTHLHGRRMSNADQVQATIAGLEDMQRRLGG